MFAPKKILVPTDFSFDKDSVLKQAIDIAKQKTLRLFLHSIHSFLMRGAK